MQSMGLQRVRLNNTHLNITMFSQCNGSVNIIVKIRNKHPQCPGFLGSSVVKNPPASAGAVGSIPGSGRSPGEENGNPLQYSCLGNPMDRGASPAAVNGVAKSWTRLKRLSMHARITIFRGEREQVFLFLDLSLRGEGTFP